MGEYKYFRNCAIFFRKLIKNSLEAEKWLKNATKMGLVLGNEPRKKTNTRYSLLNRRAMNVFSFFSD